MSVPEENSSNAHPRRVLVFAGSTRLESMNRQLAQTAARFLSDAGFESTLADLREYPMPLYEGDLEAGVGTPASVTAFQELVRQHHALVIASPEYNGSFSALVKNLVDWISRPTPGEGPLAVFRDKSAGIMSASPGRGGGQRGLRHLRELLEMVGVNVVMPHVAIASAREAFSPQGDLLRTEDREAMNSMVASLQSALRRSPSMQHSRP